MSQGFQETQCPLYAARENSKRGLPMVWEMAGSHGAYKAHSTACPDSVPTKLVAYFPISKKGKGGREGRKRKKPYIFATQPLLRQPHWSNTLPNEGCMHCWRTGEGVLMVDPGAASSNPTPNMLHLFSCLHYAWGKAKLSKRKIYLIQKGSKLNYGQMKNCYKIYIFWMLQT